jgi:hypothetical protein
MKILYKSNQQCLISKAFRTYLDLLTTIYINKNKINPDQFEERLVMNDQRLRICVRLLVYVRNEYKDNSKIIYYWDIEICELGSQMQEHKMIIFMMDSCMIFAKKNDSKKYE